MGEPDHFGERMSEPLIADELCLPEYDRLEHLST
jgi:hypothetical protein